MPVLEAEPLHEVRPQEERLEATAPRSLAPIELSPLLHAIEIQNPAESAAELGAPIPLLPLEDQRDHYEQNSPRSIDLPAPPDPRLPSRLAQKMAARDLAGARSVMREGGEAIPAGTLSAQSWSELSRAFSEDAARETGGGKRALAELALLACKRGVEVAPDGALAPRAWLAAARISDEMLGDRAGSDRMLNQLAQKFPATPEGLFALKRLGSQKS